MFHVLIDPSVWLGLGQDHHKRPLLDALEEVLEGERVPLTL